MQSMNPKRNRGNQELFQKKFKRYFLCCQKNVNEVKKKVRGVEFCRGQEYERANCDDER